MSNVACSILVILRIMKIIMDHNRRPENYLRAYRRLHVFLAVLNVLWRGR